jgi:sodium-dependent phosphate cotransporter
MRLGTIIRVVWRKLLSNKYIALTLLFIAVYTFLASIVLIGDGFEFLGEGFTKNLLSTMQDPISGLFIGILVTAVIQSSSCTTSIIVALCATGILPVETAIPAVMGANIGTTVTNTLVSLGHVTRKEEFKRAFAGATVHDFFNILTVLVLFPIEIFFHPLLKLSHSMTSAFVGVGGLSVVSPLKIIIAPVTDQIMKIMELFFHGNAGIAAVVLGLAALFLALKVLVDCTMRFTSAKSDALLNKYLFRTASTAFLLGLLLTAFVQSSSVTTSIAIPFIGAGLLTVEKIYPYTLGANIGTTVTALFAALAISHPLGIQIALVHLMFNCIGVCIWYPLRKVPIGLAKKLASAACEKKRYVILYIGITFYVLPVLYIVISRVI